MQSTLHWLVTNAIEYNSLPLVLVVCRITRPLPPRCTGLAVSLNLLIRMGEEVRFVGEEVLRKRSEGLYTLSVCVCVCGGGGGGGDTVLWR